MQKIRRVHRRLLSLIVAPSLVFAFWLIISSSGREHASIVEDDINPYHVEKEATTNNDYEDDGTNFFACRCKSKALKEKIADVSNDTFYLDDKVGS